MSYSAKVYKVMIASPGDVEDERDIIRDVISEWNAANSEARGTVLLPVGWETHSYPDMGDRAQAIINEQLKNCDLLIGVFWTRIGTATGQYPSGTVEEIQIHVDAGKPTMLYFSSALVRPENLDQSQYHELIKFKNLCKSNGLCMDYSDNMDFRSKLVRHLQSRLNSKPFTEVPHSHSEGEPVLESAIPDMPTKAKILLKQACHKSNGMTMRVHWGIQIHGWKNRIYGDLAPRERAAWENAIDVLEKLDLIRDEGNNREVFMITDRGFQVAEGIPLDLLAKPVQIE